MAKVVYKLSDRNLRDIRDSAQMPYSVRKLAAKVLDERVQQQIRVAAIAGK